MAMNLNTEGGAKRMTRFRQTLSLDLLFVAGLLALAVVPLFSFKLGLLPTWQLLALLATWLALCACWCKIFGGRLVPTSLPGTQGGVLESLPGEREGKNAAADTSSPLEQSSWLSTAVAASLLLALTWVCFYKPSQKHFWGGADEFTQFDSGWGQLWSTASDQASGRPLHCWLTPIALTLSPDRVEGFLWAACVLCWLNGLLLYAILRRLMPNSGSLPIIAGVLLIINRSDSSRFYVMWTTNFYWTALFLLLLSFWLLLLALERRSRPFLVCSCVALATGLLTSEGIFPLALLGCVFICLKGRDRHSRVVWGAAWLGTITLLASRFVVYLTFRDGQSYQTAQLSETFSQPSSFLKNFWNRLYTSRYYLEDMNPGAAWEYLGPWLLAFGLASTLVWLKPGRTESRPSLYARCVGIGLALMVSLLGMLPFLHIREPFRAMFFAAPGQAVFVASVVGLIGIFAHRKLTTALMAACVGLMAAGATAMAEKSQAVLQETSSVTFEKAVRIFDQVHALAPEAVPDTLVLFVLEDPAAGPWRVNYSAIACAKEILGTTAVQVNFSDPYQENPVFTRDGVVVNSKLASMGSAFYPYERVIAFQTCFDGTLMLLPKLPVQLLPAESHAENYRPLSCLRAGPIGPMRFFRYPPWSPRPIDVIDPNRGLVLSGDWFPLQIENDIIFRWARNGAGLVVNPSAADSLIDLEFEPGGSLLGKRCTLTITDSRDEVVVRRSLHGRQKLQIPVPTDSSKIEIYQFWIQGQDTAPRRQNVFSFGFFARVVPLGNCRGWPVPSMSWDKDSSGGTTGRT